MNPFRLGIPLILIALFLGYVVYLVVRKKDAKTIKSILYPGLFFIGVWIPLFFFLFLQ